MNKMKGIPKIEVGCGLASGDDSYAVGRIAAQQAIVDIGLHPLSVVIVFAPLSYQFDEMLSGIRSVVGDTPLLGASSAGEICNRTSSDSVAVVALASPFLKVSVGLGRQVVEDWRKAVREAVGHESIGPFFSPNNDAVYNDLIKEGRSAFAMLFSPGSTLTTDSHSPEILEELKRLSRERIPFFGGAACDDKQTGGDSNYVFCGNRAYRDSVVLAVFETSLNFGIATGHGFHPTAKKAVATKVRDCVLLELDGKPAADVFATLHDLPRESLEGKPLFEQLAKPLGRRNTLGQYTLFTPRCLTPEGGVLLAHPVPEGSPLFVMETFEDELIAAGKDTLLRAMSQSGIADPAVIIVCSCFLRMHLLKANFDKEIKAITEMMPDVPVAGFYSAGEQGITDDHVSRHNNEAITILILGRELSYAAQVAKENRILNQILKDRLAEQQRLEKQLEEQIRFLQTMIDNIPNPVFYKDPDGKFLGCNEAFEEYFEVSREKILGMSVQDLTKVDQTKLHHKMDEDLIRRGNRIAYEATIRPEDGKALHVIINKALFRKADGSVGGIVAAITDITERRNAEETLRASEEKFLKAFHNNATMMAITTLDEGRIIEVNESFLKKFGLTRQEVMGKSSKDLQVYLYPEQRDFLIRTLKEKGSARNLDIPMKKRSGDILHSLFSAELIELQNEKHILVLLQDITERKNAEETLRASEEKFMKAFQRNPTMMSIVRVTGEFIEINDSHLRHMGFTREEVIGKTAWDLNLFVHQKQCDLVRKIMEEKDDARNLDLTLRTKDGNISHCLFSAEQIKFQGEDHVLVLLQDITDQKRIEEERLQRIKLQNTLEMAGTICHEFNQPMQIISGYTDLLLSGASADSNVREKLEKIKEQAERMGKITQQLMALKGCSIHSYAGIGNIIDIYKDGAMEPAMD
jgi:PAS domain S-box-containing protein